MTIKRMEHVGIVVEDMASAIAFFVDLGLTLQGEASVEGGWAERIIGVSNLRSDIAMLETPDGHSRIELSKFHSPATFPGDPHAPTNTLGLRHIAFLVDDLDTTLARLRDRGVELVGSVE